MADCRFTFSGFAVDETVDPFGVWEATAPAGKAPSPEGLVWRAELPDAAVGLDAVLARTEALRRGEGYLSQADVELQTMLKGIKPLAAQDFGSAAAYDFAVPPTEDFHPQKQALRDMLSGLAGLDAPHMSGAVAFGPADVLPAEAERRSFQEAYRRWLAFVEQVKQLTSLSSRVETSIAGELVGLTCVDWTGDFETLWLPGTATDRWEVHRRNVNLVLASRLALLRVISIVTTGAGSLIAKAIALPPGAQVLLIPAAVRFIFDVVKVLYDWDKGQV